MGLEIRCIEPTTPLVPEIPCFRVFQMSIESLFENWDVQRRVEYSGEGLELEAVRNLLRPRVEPYWKKLSETFFLGYQKTVLKSHYPEYWWAKFETDDRLNYFRLGVVDSFEDARVAAERAKSSFVQNGDSFDQIEDDNFYCIFYSSTKDLAERYARTLGNNGRVTRAGDIWMVIKGNFRTEANKLADIEVFERFSDDYYRSGDKLLAINGNHFLFDSTLRCSKKRFIPLFNVQFKTHRVFSASKLKQMTEEGKVLNITHDKQALTFATSIYHSTLKESSFENEENVERLIESESGVDVKNSHNSSVLQSFARNACNAIDHPLASSIRVTYEKLIKQHHFAFSHEKEAYRGVFPPYRLGEFDGRPTGLNSRPSAWRYNLDKKSIESCACGSRVNSRNFRCGFCLGEICYRCGRCVNSFGNKDTSLSPPLD